MTDAEIQHYIKQVERKGNAMKLDPEKRSKWQTEYDKIVSYLKSERKRFMISNTIRRPRYYDAAVWAEFVNTEKDRFIALADRALNDGDSENFSWFCWLMHLRYMCMWKVGIDALQQEGGGHNGQA